MAGGKETPRQKMIGMMYLVLTALLAMNVSKQILQGYLSVNESLVKSKQNLTENNSRVTKAFEASIGGNAAAKPYYEKALEAQKLIQEVDKYISELRAKIVAHTEPTALENEKIADTLNLRRMDKIDDYDMPSHMLGLGEPKTPEKGPFTAYELRMKMTGLHDKLVAMVDAMQKDPKTKFLEDDYQGIKKKFASIKPTDSNREEDGVKFNWEMDNFYHLPLAAVYTNLNKFQTDLKNVEAEVLQVFSGASGKLAIKFDAIKARVVAPSSYIAAGQPYEANIFLAASSSKLAAGDMEILIGVDSAAAASGAKGSSSVPVVGGEGLYSVGTGGEGDQEYKGVIKYKNPDGSFKYYPFSGAYKVAKSAASVSADQMNVFYAGVPNPVTAAAAGISPQDISVNATGAGVRVTPKGAGKYEFNFSGTGECMVSVSAKTKDGVKSQGPPIKFRVKPLPKPELKIGGKFAPQEMKKGELGMVSGLGAGANGFDFQANFVVLSYEVTGKAKGKLMQESGTGNNLSGAAASILKGADVGSKIYIDAKVKGPDGKITSTTVGIKVAK
ncbi:MAG: GldM family protein [Bacteroidia bacterium]